MHAWGSEAIKEENDASLGSHEHFYTGSSSKPGNKYERLRQRIHEQATGENLVDIYGKQSRYFLLHMISAWFCMQALPRER